MRKIFVLDTNVLIHDPQSIFKFDEHHVVVPFDVIEELDRLKRGHGEIAYSARQSLKLIDALREKGSISKGVALKGGGTFCIEHVLTPTDNSGADNRIIGTAVMLRDRYQYYPDASQETVVRPALPPPDHAERIPVILVSKDTAVRIKAEAVGLIAEDYTHDKTSIFKQYGRVLGEDDYNNGMHSVRYCRNGDDVYRLRGEDSQFRIRLGKCLEGILPKNIEQECAVDALTCPDIEIVALTGAAGTGKTLFALAAALHQTTKRSPLYEQVVVARPVVPMGNDLGYLPGDVNEKLLPWMQPIFDNLEVIVHTPKDSNMQARYPNYQYLIDTGTLQIEPLTYIRGRSLPGRYFIIDEAQNLRPLDIKTIITRCGEGTKIVFTGDLQQIDAPYLDSASNGLAYLISRFIDEENFCYLNLKNSVRSRLAEQGARLL
ncbi:MAG TPA: PhoH family protein [Dissulfurispiraceae bacterium]|nr:PhoH family protein [Dissulfurispiraceae bacterium]